MDVASVRLEAVVVEAISSAQFQVELPNGRQLSARVSGQIRMHFIRIVPGDRVTVELSPLDPYQARIVHKNS